MESEILKFICGSQGAVDAEDLMFNLFPGEATNEVISNQNKFVIYPSYGKQRVVARTSLRLCRETGIIALVWSKSLTQAEEFKDLVLFTSDGRMRIELKIQIEERSCSFSHDLSSDHNQRLLKEHELDCLSREELCTLLLQSEHTLLPSICHDYNNGDGPFGRCQSGNACARLHICQRYLTRDCACYRIHDFFAPQPLKTLYDLRVPDNIIRSLRSVYANKEVLRFSSRQSFAVTERDDGSTGEQMRLYRGRGRGGNRGHRGYWDNRGHRGNWGTGAGRGIPLQHQRTASLSDILAKFSNEDVFNEDGDGQQRDLSSPNSDVSDLDQSRQWAKYSSRAPAVRGRGGNQGNYQRFPRTGSTSDMSAAAACSKDGSVGDEQSYRQRQKTVKDNSEICLYFLKGGCRHGDRCVKSHIRLPYGWKVQEVDWRSTLPDDETIKKDDCDPKNSSRIQELKENKCGAEKSTQTESEEDSGQEEKAESELEKLKSQAQALQLENDRLKLQLSRLQPQSQMEQKKADEERNSLAQLKDAYTKLFEDYNKLREEKKKESQPVEKELVDDLQQRLTAAEEALAVKQMKIDEMKQEIFLKEKDLEQISVFQAQAEVYCSDFYAEREAREKLQEEKERLAAQLEYVKKQNNQLQEEMDSRGRRSLGEMLMRHKLPGGNPHGVGGPLVGTGADRQHQGNIPEHTCPKCNEILPDLDSLTIHIMDCIN